jgi:hypothetical protein
VFDAVLFRDNLDAVVVIDGKVGYRACCRMRERSQETLCCLCTTDVEERSKRSLRELNLGNERFARLE